MAALVAVVSWKVAASTYAGDVGTICEAEGRSGRRLDRGMGLVSEWIRAHVVTPEGGRLFEAVRDTPMAERGSRLRALAFAVSAARCPLADSYDALEADGQYRADMQHACSRFTLPASPDLPPALRVERLAEWLEMNGITDRARAVAAAMHAAASVHESALLLREAATEADHYYCEGAGLLEVVAPLVCAPR